VFLGIRAYDERFHNTGRETFMLPMRWEYDWPIILDAKTRVPYQVRRPDLAGPGDIVPPQAGNFTWRDEFDADALEPDWLQLRTSTTEWFRSDSAQGNIELDALPIALTDRAQPAYLARRQQHGSFSASTRMDLALPAETTAGIAIFQSADFHYFLGVKNSHGSLTAVLEEVRDGNTRIVESVALARRVQSSIELGINQTVDKISFYYSANGTQRTWLAQDLDARLLSTQVAGGFVGATIGMHARRDR
jgi:alpha-N-arabinofuranosidase